jgi:hypothetical protein
LAPVLVAAIAATTPAVPPPATTTSNSLTGNFFASSLNCQALTVLNEKLVFTTGIAIPVKRTLFDNFLQSISILS